MTTIGLVFAVLFIGVAVGLGVMVCASSVRAASKGLHSAQDVRRQWTVGTRRGAVHSDLRSDARLAVRPNQGKVMADPYEIARPVMTLSDPPAPGIRSIALDTTQLDEWPMPHLFPVIVGRTRSVRSTSEVRPTLAANGRAPGRTPSSRRPPLHGGERE